MTVREAIGDLAGLSWICSFEGVQRAAPDSMRAVISKVSMPTADGLSVAVKDGENTYSTNIEILDKSLRERLRSVLTEAIGKSLAEVGDLEL